MKIEKLKLLNFKNYASEDLDFSSKINVLTGPNGSGKTNLLDAIHYLSFTRSAFNSSDYQNIKHGENYFFIKGKLNVHKTHEITCGVQLGTKKSFKDENVEYQKLSEHIGKYPVVLLAPDDVDLVKEGNESRRKFFDSIISQIDKIYLDNLIQYNNCLKQRNGLLKMFHESGGSVDWIALESYDQILIPLGKAIYNKRKTFVQEFIPIFRQFFNFLVEDKEITNLNYSSVLDRIEFQEGLFGSRTKDLTLQRTNFGVHRDEYDFTLGDGDLRRLGSQGQQKSFVIALKLAQNEVIKAHKGFSPILLLDDIFDKLDDLRIGKLLELIKNDLGQLFITDARPDRTKGLLQQINVLASIFVVNDGKVNSI